MVVSFTTKYNIMLISISLSISEWFLWRLILQNIKKYLPVFSWSEQVIFVQALEGRPILALMWVHEIISTCLPSIPFRVTCIIWMYAYHICICDIHKLPPKKGRTYTTPDAKVHDIIDIHAITMNTFSYDCVLFGCTLVTFCKLQQPMLNWYSFHIVCIKMVIISMMEHSLNCSLLMRCVHSINGK